jgi:hypothetical protein
MRTLQGLTAAERNEMSKVAVTEVLHNHEDVEYEKN